MRAVALLLLAVAAGPTLAAPDHDEACESIPAEIHLIKGTFNLEASTKLFYFYHLFYVSFYRGI